jgi:Arc/MetJ-type ribon-helix-helix transcriptional regulator
MKTIQTEIPEQLYKEILTLVKEGWFRDEKDVYSAAIRRFLDTHRPELMEKFVRDDVEWGLHGNDQISIKYSM